MRPELPKNVHVLHNVWLMTGLLSDTFKGVGDRQGDAHKAMRFASDMRVPWYDVVGPIRRRDFVEVRQLVSLYLKEQEWTYKEIGEFLGGRDHSTAVYAVKCARGLMDVDRDFQRMYIKLLQA